jgi:hypothetical protein
MPKLLYTQAIEEDSRQLEKLEKHHRYTHLFRRVRMLERVMNSIRNALGMPKTEIAREPRRPWNPHFYAIFAQVHNTL